jgi:signal transduction histidine kinase
VASVVPVASVAAISWALLDRWARVESELEQRTKELIRNHDALCHAHQQLVRKEQLAAVGELSAIIAHELRNPLAILRHAVSGLRREDLRRDDAETLLRILDEEVDRLNRLVQDVMTYARPVTPEPTPVRVQELVARAVELARESHPQHKAIAFAFRSEGADDIVEGDPALLRHALINIVDNAIQAMPDGGTVTITVRSTQLDGREALAIDFQDEGEGMDTLVRSKARDPFFTTRASGTGLGLAIVDRVARMHGGRVEIESQYGQGTTVTLILPRRRVSSPPPATFG